MVMFGCEAHFEMEGVKIKSDVGVRLKGFFFFFCYFDICAEVQVPAALKSYKNVSNDEKALSLQLLPYSLHFYCSCHYLWIFKILDVGKFSTVVETFDFRAC